MSVVTNRRPSERWANFSLGLLLGLLLLVFSCGHERSSEPTGGETHFLARCTSGSTCGGGLSCLCGVCTRACDARAECQSLSDAACVASSSEACAESPATGHCDVACISDDDCAVLSPSHRCEGGACRAGVKPPSACAHGEVAANQVLLIGDSFFASSHQVTAFLEDIARSAAALSVGERYRDNSRVTGNALALGGPGIADEYADAIAESEVRVVIMSGGGADVLVGSCDTVDASCPTLVEAAAAARALLAKMASDGVLDVVYVSYPDPLDSSVRAKMDAIRPLLQDACDGSAVPCHWLDLRPTFAGRYDELILPDGINPTAAGSSVTAQAIWDVMQQKCIAQ